MVSDLDLPRAKAQADKYGVAKFGTTDQLLADSEVEVVVNLTILQCTPRRRRKHCRQDTRCR